MPAPLILGEVGRGSGNESSQRRAYFAYFGGAVSSHPVRRAMLDALASLEGKLGGGAAAAPAKRRQDWPRRVPEADGPRALRHGAPRLYAGGGARTPNRPTDCCPVLLSSAPWMADGRNLFGLAEAVQNGNVPLYVWDDLPWLPYRPLWERGELGLSVRYDALVPLLLHNFSVARRCSPPPPPPPAKGVFFGARSRRCADAEAQVERMRAGVRKWRRLFTYEGLLDEIEAFASSEGARGWLRCEPRSPVRNVERARERKLRLAIS